MVPCISFSAKHIALSLWPKRTNSSNLSIDSFYRVWFTNSTSLSLILRKSPYFVVASMQFLPTAAYTNSWLNNLRCSASIFIILHWSISAIFYYCRKMHKSYTLISDERIMKNDYSVKIICFGASSNLNNSYLYMSKGDDWLSGSNIVKLIPPV